MFYPMLPVSGKTYTGRYLNTNQNMDNPEKLATLGKTDTGRYQNMDNSETVSLDCPCFDWYQDIVYVLPNVASFSRLSML
jgi:hypothetical protein